MEAIKFAAHITKKRAAFDRFYFISDDELLSVLGSSGHEAVQPLMLKLFDNCKKLLINGSGQVTCLQKLRFSFCNSLRPAYLSLSRWVEKVMWN